MATFKFYVSMNQRRLDIRWMTANSKCLQCIGKHRLALSDITSKVDFGKTHRYCIVAIAYIQRLANVTPDQLIKIKLPGETRYCLFCASNLASVVFLSLAFTPILLRFIGESFNPIPLTLRKLLT